MPAREKLRSVGNWAATFDRFPTGRTPLVGPIQVEVADWSQPAPGCGPMFENRWLERVSIAHPALPAAIYGPAGAWLLWRGWQSGIGIVAAVAAYLAGLLVWSLLEYTTHRGSFHHVPTSKSQVAYGYLIHGIHHAYPDDSRRWVMPAVVTLPVALVLYAACAVTLGHFAAPAFGGFIHGYLTYDLLHYFIHRGRMPTRIGRFLRQYHLTHHYASPDRHFGVSSPLWDIVFRTK